VVATVVEIVAFVVVIALAPFSHHGAARVAFGLVVGGGAANLIDRLASGSRGVTDFVSIGSFPSFNLADASVTVGVVILVLLALRGQKLLRA
jgi:signal peptidase II